jgi:hypothetical protein
MSGPERPWLAVIGPDRRKPIRGIEPGKRFLESCRGPVSRRTGRPVGAGVDRPARLEFNRMCSVGYCPGQGSNLHSL